MSALPDDDAGASRVQLDHDAVGGALDLDARQGRVVVALATGGAALLGLERAADVAADALVFDQEFLVGFLGIPAAVPGLDDAQAQAVRMDFLSHSVSLLLLGGQPGLKYLCRSPS